MSRAVPALSLLIPLVAGCATGSAEPSPDRDFTIAAQGEITPQARLFAACLDQAVDRGTYGRASDPDTELVRFDCDGDPARALYDALDAWSLARDSRWERDGWAYRSTDRVRRDLFGVDWCGSDGRAYRCAINLNLGEFGTPR